MPAIATRSPSPTVVKDSLPLPPALPDLPDDVLRRFPSLRNWQEDTGDWYTKLGSAIQDSQGMVSQTITAARATDNNLRVSINGATAAIIVEREARITEDEILARWAITVSAMAGKSTNIKVQGTPPAAPSLSDIWIDSSIAALPVTYIWDGLGWAEVEEPITVAAVADERTARVTADGYLEGKYSLTVIAGNVVTGMNITSASGPGTNISSVIFRATDFLIYNSVTGIAMFDVSGTAVRLAGTLTVSTSGKVFIGTGTYGNTNTAWYVDSSGNFSLKDKLTWDGTTLTITGSIAATTGSIGGFDIGTDYIRDAANSMGLASTVTGGDDVRFWAGAAFASRASAPFRVLESGIIVATAAAITGTISGRSTATIASTIDASGIVVTDLINARLDTSTKKMLSDFTFGTADYSGALKSGTITWNTTTGAITGGSGVLVYRGGIIGAAAGTATFTIDAATGAATFAGALSAPTGNIGGWSIGSSTITGGSVTLDSTGNVRAGQTAYNTGTGFWLGVDSGTPKFSIGSSTNKLLWDGSTLSLQTTGTIVTTSTILNTNNASYTTWQGPAGVSQGIIVQAESTTTGFYSLAAGGAARLALLGASGTFGAMTASTTDAVVGRIEVAGYNGSSFVDVSRMDWGTITGVSTPYSFWSVMPSGTTNLSVVLNGYDGKVYLSAATIFPVFSGFGAPYINTGAAYGSLYPSAANTLKTDGAFIAVGAISASNLSGTNTGDQTSVSGNAGTATVLQTARTINGTSFNGSANVGQDLTTSATGISFGSYSSSATAVMRFGVPVATVGLAMKGNANGFYSFHECVNENGDLMFQASESGVVTCVSLVQTSSARFKSQIEDMDRRTALELVRRMKPRTYFRSGKADLGFIAEEMVGLVPEIVGLDREGRPHGIDYSRAITIVVAAFQELLDRFERV